MSTQTDNMDAESHATAAHATAAHATAAHATAAHATAAHADAIDPAVGLRAVVALHRLAERVEATNVAAARAAGWSWEQIGDALGVTRQSVHAKHGKAVS